MLFSLKNLNEIYYMATDINPKATEITKQTGKINKVI